MPDQDRRPWKASGYLGDVIHVVAHPCPAQPVMPVATPIPSKAKGMYLPPLGGEVIQEALDPTPGCVPGAMNQEQRWASTISAAGQNLDSRTLGLGRRQRESISHGNSSLHGHAR